MLYLAKIFFIDLQRLEFLPKRSRPRLFRALAAYLATTMVALLTFAQKQPPLPYLGSELEIFLKTHDQNTIRVVEKDVGSLSSQSEARFMAVIAWDPSAPEVRFKGMKIVLLKPGGRTGETVYMDGECLNHIDQLRSLDKRKNAIVERFRLHEPPESKWEELTFLKCRWKGGPPDQATTCLNLGWFADGHVIGVIIRSYRSGVDYQFPGAEVGAIVELLDTGRLFVSG